LISLPDVNPDTSVAVSKDGRNLGTQHGPALSPDVYRSIVWPRYRKLWYLIKSKSAANIF
jgi:hypothetical protein